MYQVFESPVGVQFYYICLWLVWMYSSLQEGFCSRREDLFSSEEMIGGLFFLYIINCPIYFVFGLWWIMNVLSCCIGFKAANKCRKRKKIVNKENIFKEDNICNIANSPHIASVTSFPLGGIKLLLLWLIIYEKKFLSCVHILWKDASFLCKSLLCLWPYFIASVSSLCLGGNLIEQ